jgi:diguanylate cyclase
MLIRVHTVGTPVAATPTRSYPIAQGYSVVGVLLMVAAAVAGGSGRRLSYFVAVSMVLPAICIGHRVHQAGRALCIPMVITVVAFLFADILPSVSALRGRGEVVDSLIGLPTVLGHLAFIGCLVSIVRLRHGRHLWSLVGDATIVAIGAWLVSWVTMIRPAIESSGEAASATLVHGLSQPLGVVMIFLLVMLLLADTFRTPAVWLIGAASASMLAGDIGYAATAAGHLSSGSRVFDMFYMGSFLLAGAMFLHPGVRSLHETIPVGPTRGPAGRIFLTSISMLIPAVILAGVPTVSTSDRVVRFVSAISMIAAVSARIYEAVRSNASAQERLLTNAQHDMLTGLPNRQLVHEQITAALHDAWRSGSRPAVLFIDIDRFKIINDSLGHSAGDEILRYIARRLRATLPTEVALGRSSGDEFIAIGADVRTPAEALELADRVLSAFREPLRTPTAGDMHLSASVGVALPEFGGRPNADELLRNADTAMYRAKDSGRNCAALFDESMHQRVAQRLRRESGLHRALDRREIALAYQPIVDLWSGELVGFEALMRWRLPDGTMVPPTEFIPIAEETGLILGLGAWALLEALTQLRGWIDTGVCPASASMSVNVSPRQLRDPAFSSVVREALRRSGVPADQLWLEVTESVMITDPEQASEMFHRLRATGAHLSMDDFGTGYSSLSLLRRYPLQRIKIDQSFVASVADDDNARSLVRTILAMAESMGLDAVAEGVENVDQFHALRDLGCRRAQGYLFSRPVPPEAIERSVTGVPYGDQLKRAGAVLWP